MDREKKLAAKAFGLPIAQMRYYDELNDEQRRSVALSYGIIPDRGGYVYAVKRNGDLVWDRKRTVELLRQN